MSHTGPMPIVPGAIQPVDPRDSWESLLAHIVYQPYVSGGAYFGEYPAVSGRPGGTVWVVQEGLPRRERLAAVARARRGRHRAGTRFGPGAAALVTLSVDCLRRLAHAVGSVATSTAGSTVNAVGAMVSEHTSAAVAAAAAAVIAVGGITAASLPHHASPGGRPGSPGGSSWAQPPPAQPRHARRRIPQRGPGQAASPSPSPGAIPQGDATGSPQPVVTPPAASGSVSPVPTTPLPTAPVPSVTPTISPDPTVPPTPVPTPSGCLHGIGGGQGRCHSHSGGDDSGTLMSVLSPQPLL